MKLKIFQSDKGDCMLISSQGANVLVDGGMSSSYNEHVSAYLGKLRNKSEKLDLVCVSHIDEDHISGILKMIEDEVDWRVADHHGGSTKPPKSTRPPEIKEIWHNAFHEYIKDNNSEIEDTLASTAAILSSSDDPLDIGLGGLAYSVGQAIQLSRRLKPEQLGIPLNKRYKGKLVMYRKGKQAMTIGGMKLSVIAPFPKDLENLREEWNDWLRENKKQLKQIRDRVKKDEGSLGASMDDISYLIALSKILGDRTEVTAPNLASIMFLLEEDSKTLLMTGDGHWEDILNGLEKIGKLDRSKGLHINALKVQHHGSEHNIHEDFCKLLTADHYFFCGNGFSSNPEIDVIDAIIKSRTSSSSKVRAITSQVGKDFTLWFNSSSKITKPNYKAHMAKVEKFVKAKAKNNSQVKFKFMPEDKSYFSLTL